MDLLFERFLVCLGVILDGSVFLEEAFGYLVDPLVRALGREDGCDQKLKGISVI